MDEQELSQIEHYMSLVHGLALQVTEIANRTERLVLVVDLKGLKLKTLNNKMLNAALKRLIPMCSQFFPELLHRGFIVNAPMFFSQLWSTVEKLLSPETRLKLRVIGAPSDPRNHRTRISYPPPHQVPLSALPPTMGGSWNGGAAAKAPGSPPEDLEDGEELKENDESVSQKLEAIKKEFVHRIISPFLRIGFPHISAAPKHASGDDVLLKAQEPDMDLPPISATPVNTLVEEENEEGENEVIMDPYN
jgi:hypothetical protein